MKVLKFGGTSVADIKSLNKVIDIIKETEDQKIIVVSALSGMTNILEKMAELGLSPSFLVGHVHYWGKAFVEDIFGLKKASKLDRTGACEDKGIRWSLHSDDPVTEMNPLRCMENAVVRNMWRSDELLHMMSCQMLLVCISMHTAPHVQMRM